MRKHSALPRIRIVRDDGTILMGPGKADLLTAIADSGSIRSAAEELGMSYMRAWTLVRTMNDAFKSPLVESVRGGAEKGGARLTQRGQKVLHLYRQMEERAVKAMQKQWAALRKEI